MFKTITSATNKTVAKNHLNVQLTEQLLQIQETSDALAVATDDVMSQMAVGVKVIDELFQLGKTIKLVEKTKLQPSACAVFASMEGFDMVSGIDLKTVTSENRNSLTTVAMEGMKEKAASAWKWLKEFFVNLGTKIKEFFLRLFDKNRAQMTAVGKLTDGVLKKVDKVDADAFKEVKGKYLSSSDFGSLAKNCISMITKLSNVGVNQLSVEKFDVAGIGAWNFLGKKVNEDNKLVNADERPVKPVKEATKMSDMGWDVTAIEKHLGDVKIMLAAVSSLKKGYEATSKTIKDAISSIDKLMLMKESDGAEKEKLDAAKKNLPAYLSMINIVCAEISSLSGQWISICSKLKVKKEAKK